MSIQFETTRTTESHATITKSGESVVIEVPFAYDTAIEPFYDEENGCLRYAVRQDDTSEYEFPEGVFFADASVEGAEAPNALFEEFDTGQLPEGELLAVGKYNHGMVSYTVHGDKTYPDMEWDYGICGVIFVPNDFTNPREAASAILEEYTDWCNGNVYMLIEVPLNHEDEWDVCGGVIGDKAITEAVKFGL